MDGCHTSAAHPTLRVNNLAQCVTIRLRYDMSKYHTETIVRMLPHHRLMDRMRTVSFYQVRPNCGLYIIPFSAFWLRSCVVSVLISLIAYMVLIENLRLTSIFRGAVVNGGACAPDPPAWLRPYTTAAESTLPIQ